MHKSVLRLQLPMIRSLNIGQVGGSSNMPRHRNGALLESAGALARLYCALREIRLLPGLDNSVFKTWLFR